MCASCESADGCTVCNHPNTVPPLCNLRSECMFAYPECNYGGTPFEICGSVEDLDITFK